MGGFWGGFAAGILATLLTMTAIVLLLLRNAADATYHVDDLNKDGHKGLKDFIARGRRTESVASNNPRSGHE